MANVNEEKSAPAQGVGRRDYAERRAARIARLEARAGRARQEGNARIAGAQKIADGIPLGQPILLGHHSEGRHRRALKRIDEGYARGFGLLKEAEKLERRAARSEKNTAISSDDPEAIDKLRAKLAELERIGAIYVAANKRLRAGETIEAIAPMFDWLPPGRIVQTFRTWQSLGHKTFPRGNDAAERRRVQGRISELESRAAAPARAAETIGSVTITESDNRVQLRFPGKPADAVRTQLKRSGFRWAPSEGAWQRQASERAWIEARRIAALV
ncbi:MAG TPA: DUF3560 domain-containing protein [Lacunisphaera sp.]|nr:DUF3560 domain-containing protein [Lacunisphaera sp.]